MHISASARIAASFAILLTLALFSQPAYSADLPDRQSEQVAAVLQASLGDDPSASRDDLVTLLGGGLEVSGVVSDGERVEVFMIADPEFLALIDEGIVDFIYQRVRAGFMEVEGNPRIALLVADRDDLASPFKPLHEYLPPPPPILTKEMQHGLEPPAPRQDAETRNVQNPQIGQGQPTGALAGKSIFLSAGHGWYWASSLNRWATQRGLSQGMIEDHANADFVNNWMTKYFWNAGAGVYTVRERDMNSNMVIVDNGGTGYTETGSWSTVSGGYGGSRRVTPTTTGSPTATARFTPNIPTAGFYGVYVWYQRSDPTTQAAQITVNHAGGSTLWVQDMNRDGFTWKYIGHYYFDPGSNPNAGSVLITNQSTSSGNVIADAVRFGGGMGQMQDPDSGTTSGKPQFEESGRYYAGFMGKSNWASFGTVNAMPSYAAWEHESWEDSLYISLHSDASSNTSARGFLAITYGTCWECWDDNTYAGVTGSRELRELVRTEVVRDIRALYDPTWANRASISRAYGEVNPNVNDKMPSILLEIGFHTSPTDAAAMRDPRMRQITARAIYKGVVKYFAQRDSIPVRLLPEPPTHFRAKLDSNNTITLQWNAPPNNGGNQNQPLGDPATGYRVYMGTHGKGFDNGIAVAGTSHTISSGLVPGATYYFRVSATNLGGESFPTETLAVRYQPGKTNPILVVHGFDRLDGDMNIVTADGAHRQFLDRMNTFDYTVTAARDITAYDQYFDSASNEAVDSGAVNLGNYLAVVWLAGNQSSVDKTFTAAGQSRMTTYLNGGGQLFVSGADIGYDLQNQGGGASFYNNILKASFVGRSSNTYNVNPSAGGIFNGLGGFSFDNGTSIYKVDQADRFTATGGATANLSYSGGNGGTAGLQFDGTYRLVYLGFPYETIVDSATRTLVMARVLDFFDFEGEVDVVPDIILESRDPGGNLTPDPPYTETGSWTNSVAKSTAPGLVGDGSRFSESASPSNDTVRMAPDLPRAGVWEVAATWNTSSNATNVSYIVNHAGGTSTVFVDQEPVNTPGGGNHDQWIVLGQYSFPAGYNPQTCSVTMDESTVTGTVTTYNTGRVYSDGFRWRFIRGEDVPTPTPSPSPTASPSPTPTPTPSPSPTPTTTPTPSPSPSPSSSPTATPTASPSPSPSPSPSASPSPTPAPTASATPAPTATSEPTATPSPSPSPTASPTPSATPTPSPTPAMGDPRPRVLGRSDEGDDVNGNGLIDAADVVKWLIMEGTGRR